jgi:hypothetical protein
LEKKSNNVLSQISILKKCLIKCNKINGITPMNIHVDIVHPKLFTQGKVQLAKKIAIVDGE